MWAWAERRAIEDMDVGSLPDDLWRVYVELHMLAHMYVDCEPMNRWDMEWRLHRLKDSLEEKLQLLNEYDVYPLKEVERYREQRTRRIRWGKIRQKVLERDDYTCAYCGGEADSVDHVMPRSRGGPDAMDNLVAACRSCNATKHDQTPEEAGMEITYGAR